MDQAHETSAEVSDEVQSFTRLAGSLIEEADAIASEFDALLLRTHRWRVAVQTSRMHSVDSPDGTAPSA